MTSQILKKALVNKFNTAFGVTKSRGWFLVRFEKGTVSQFDMYNFCEALGLSRDIVAYAGNI